MSIFYADPYGGAQGSGNGSSAANRAASPNTITPSAGDVVRIAKTPDPTLVGNCTWTNLSSTVTIPAGRTKDITNCETGWTASANVTATTTSTNVKQGTNAANISIASAFTTGLVAYFPLGATTDYSGFQQLCLFIKTSTTQAAGVFQIKLCSDTVGAVPVNTFNMDATNPSATWHTIVKDNGSALGSSIQSVALYAVSDPGTVVVNLDNIFASLAPATTGVLTLNTLISKNSGNELWFRIQSITGTTLTLDYAPNIVIATGSAVYLGATESVNTYSSIPAMLTSTTAAGTIVTAQASGTIGNLVTYSGGWNTSDMTSQTGYTFLAGNNGQGYGFSYGARNFVKVEYMGFFGFSQFINMAANLTLNSFDHIYAGGCSNTGITNSGAYSPSFSNFWIGTAVNYGIQETTGTFTKCTNGYIESCLPTNKQAIYSDSISPTFTNVNIKHTSIAFQAFFGNDYKFINCSTVGGTATFTVPQFTTVMNALNCTFGEATRITGNVAFSNFTLYSQNEGGTYNNNIMYTDGGTMGYDVGNSWWYISPTSANRSVSYPMVMPIAQVACQANSLVTVQCVVNRTNTGITATLVCPGNQIAGVSSDVTASAAGSVNADETVTITFTPTANGVVNINLNAYGGTTFTVKIKSMNIYQA